jgi:hypothetical protein
MGRKSLKKVVDHPALQPGERVIDACWGLGRGLLKAADIAGLTILDELVRDKPTYQHQLDAATTGEGMGSRIDRNGIIVLTDRRLLWMPVSTAVMKPKQVEAEFALDQVEDIVYDKPILAVRFSDGSAGGVHAGPADKPAAFVQAWRALRAIED